MYHLRLAKALSYLGYGLSVTKKHPDVIIEDPATAFALSATGYFRLLENENPPLQDGGDDAQDAIPDGIMPYGGDNAEYVIPPDGKPQGKTLDDMTRAELETFAAYKNVSVKGLHTKTAVIAKLREFLGEEETSGAIEYGSPTMTELQQL